MKYFKVTAWLALQFMVLPLGIVIAVKDFFDYAILKIEESL